MAVKVVAKPDRRYLQDRDGQFRPIENLSITASTPVYPAVLHKTRRTMILADDMQGMWECNAVGIYQPKSFNAYEVFS